MKKKFLLIVLITSYTLYSQCFCTSYSQSLFLRTGKNYTKFDFSNAETIPLDLHSDVGNTFEVGVNFIVKDAMRSNRFHYELGLKLEDFNAYLEEPYSAVTYNLQYLGINNSLYIAIVAGNRDHNRFMLDVKGGFGLFKYIAGKEMILNKIYDLQSFPEFRNVFGVATLGLHSRIVVSDYFDLGLGYDRSFSFLNTGNVSNKSLSFSSNQYIISIYFPIN